MIKSKLFWLELLSGILLVAGIAIGYFGISSAVFYLIGDIGLLILITFFYSWLPSSNVQPGPLLVGGGLILLVSLLGAYLIANSAKEVVDSEGIEIEYWTFLGDTYINLTPVLLIGGVAVIVRIIRTPKKNRDDHFQVEFLKRIGVVFLLFCVGWILLYLMGESALTISIALVITRILILWFFFEKEKVEKA
ncbi:MAG: hypothetical protein MK078_14880 [Crocinitomicaceae bacterium]|nr:hypothetical protein [Crocinitomicaceae bacterium]